MARYSTKPVITRVYKVSDAERDLLRSLKVEDETWFDYLERLGNTAATLDLRPKGSRNRNLRLDLPAETYEALMQRGEATGHSVLGLLLAAAEHLRGLEREKPGGKAPKRR